MKDNFSRDVRFENKTIRKSITEKRREAKQSGNLINSLDKLVCLNHNVNGEKNFVEYEQIPNYNSENEEHSKQYICEMCKEEEKTTENKKFKPAKFYYCNKCKGYVFGEPRKKFYLRSRQLKILEIGEDKINYMCTICKENLGYKSMFNKKNND